MNNIYGIIEPEELKAPPTIRTSVTVLEYSTESNQIYVKSVASTKRIGSLSTLIQGNVSGNGMTGIKNLA